MSALYVALGGALGALARYGLSGWIHGFAGPSFPWGTFGVNIVGSGFIGLALGWLEASTLPAEVREFVAIGLLGAFTTFSTFTYETAGLLRDGEWSRAGLYVVGSVALGLAAVFAGFRLADVALRPR